MARIIHGADPGGLGQSIDLQYWNAQHAEVVLCLGRERRGSADQSLKVCSADFLADRGEHHGVRQPQPERIDQRKLPLSTPCGFCPPIKGFDDSSLPGDLFIDTPAHPLEQLRHVQEIVRSDDWHVARDLRQVGVQSNQAAAEQESEHGYPRSAEIEWKVVKDAILSHAFAHKQVQPCRSTAQHETHIGAGEYHPFRFSRRARSVYDRNGVLVANLPSVHSNAFHAGKDLIEKKKWRTLGPSLLDSSAQSGIATADGRR